MNLQIETEYLKKFVAITGCDEVGRGCLAGPVVAGAVWVNTENLQNLAGLENVKDSKKLSAKQREKLALIIQEKFPYAVAEVSSEEIDKINILEASLLAMQKSLKALHKKLETEKNLDKTMTLVDGKFLVPNLQSPQTAIIDGDAKVFCIAMASIVAKVYRDNLMMKLHEEFPAYDFAHNKGYGTKKHFSALREHGVTKHHRQSFTLFHETV